jgi:hypothetical protein
MELAYGRRFLYFLGVVGALVGKIPSEEIRRKE